MSDLDVNGEAMISNLADYITFVGFVNNEKDSNKLAKDWSGHKLDEAMAGRIKPSKVLNNAFCGIT